MSKMKISLLTVLAILVAAIAVTVVMRCSLPRLNVSGELVYDNRRYVPIPDGYYYEHDGELDKAVGKYGDATVYTLQNDSSHAFLKPVVFYTSYVLFVREDIVLPTLESGEVERIELILPKEDAIRDQHIPAETVRFSAQDEQKLVDAYRRKAVLTDHWTANEDSVSYTITIHFCEPSGLYHHMKLVPHENQYALLLEDGKTLIEVGTLECLQDGYQ